MAQLYKYSVVLRETKTNELKRIVVTTLNHPMDETDLSGIEKTHSKTDTRAQNYSYVVTGWQLLNITGTFSYRVYYRQVESFCTPTYGSVLCNLPHQITTKTYEEDMRSIADQLKKLSGGRHYLQMVSFQEIPDA